MVKKSILFNLVFLLVSAFSYSFAQGADAVLGNWLVEDKDAIVNVFKCGDKYCAKISCLKEPNEDGQPKVDKKNPDDSLKSRPLLGLTFMTGFTYDDWKYVDGKIYKSANGKTYCGKLVPDGKKVKLKGNICYTFLGASSEWERIDSTAGFACK